MTEESPDDDRRRYKRIDLELSLRYLVDSGEEQKGQTLDVSAGGLSVKSDAKVELGQHIILYIEELDRVEGKVVRVFDGGFAVEAKLSDKGRDRLVESLTFSVNRESLGLEEADKRSFPRYPVANRKAQFQMADGKTFDGRIVDMSLTGVQIECKMKPPRGDLIIVGKMRARVVRHTDLGFAAEFLMAARSGRPAPDPLSPPLDRGKPVRQSG